MLTLHLEADSHEALVAKAAKTLGIQLPHQTELPLAAAPTPSVTLPLPEPRTPRAKKTPTPPAAAPAAALPEAPAASSSSTTKESTAAATPVASSTPPAAVAAPVASASSPAVPSADEVRAALRPLVTAFGGGEAGEIKAGAWMASVGYERVSLVPEAKRAEFIAQVNAKIASLAPAATVPTVDEVRYALSEVNGACGFPAATAMVKSFGVEQYSAVPEGRRAEFIAACKAKAASKQS